MKRDIRKSLQEDIRYLNIFLEAKGLSSKLRKSIVSYIGWIQSILDRDGNPNR